MIPKVIHVFWIGDQSKRPSAWIDSWRVMNAGYDIRLWTNSEVSSQTWALPDLINKWFRKEIAGAVDIMRWEVLYRFGGIAIDADSECIRPLDNWLLETECFAAWENEISRPGLVATGALGCVPGHYLFRQVLIDIKEDKDPFSGAAWQKVGPQRLTNTIARHSNLPITIYPSHYFYPKHYTGRKYEGSGQIYARQFWKSTSERASRLGITHAGIEEDRT